MKWSGDAMRQAMTRLPVDKRDDGSKARATAARTPGFGSRAFAAGRGACGTGLAFLLTLLILTGCSPTQRNVAVYLLADATDALQPADTTVTGILSGTVTGPDGPIADATMVVADRIGNPFSAVSDARGQYRIDGVPAGTYVVTGVAHGFEESQWQADTNTRVAVTVPVRDSVTAPPLVLTPLKNAQPADVVGLTQTRIYSATSVFPPGSTAQVRAYRFTRNGVVNDSLRVYTPLDADPTSPLPMLFAVYPGTVDGWEPVSVSFAAQGYAVVAVAPNGAWELNLEEHAADARVALALAQENALGVNVDSARPIALGGSFSSAILYRLLRQNDTAFSGWVTVGGIADAFRGAAAFYTGEIQVPPAYRFAIPGLGNPNRNPVAFLRFSPVYGVKSLPPTLIIHTSADEIIPLDHAIALETALRDAGVPVETFYYQDVSHYLQIDEEMTDAGREMYYRVLEFIERYGNPPATGP